MPWDVFWTFVVQGAIFAGAILLTFAMVGAIIMAIVNRYEKRARKD